MLLSCKSGGQGQVVSGKDLLPLLLLARSAESVLLNCVCLCVRVLV